MSKFFKDRNNILFILFLLISIIILARLFDLQIIHGEEKLEESKQRFLYESTIDAPRGEITDRYGVPLATNRRGFNVQILKRNQTVGNAERNEMILRLVKLFEKNGDQYISSIPLKFNPLELTFERGENGEISESEKKWKSKYEIKANATAREVFEALKSRYEIDKSYSDEDAFRIITIRYEMDERGFSSIKPLLIARDVSNKTVAELSERQFEFPGVYVSEVYFRQYNEGSSVAHIIGYVGRIDAEEYSNLKSEGYDINDIIGKDGLELTMETYLRGKKGYQKNEVDSYGNYIQSDDAADYIAPKPGDKVILTIDTELQKAAEESLQATIKKVRETPDGDNYGDCYSGSAVVLDVHSGEILAMVSVPSYDPSIFLETTDSELRNAKIAEWNSEEAHKPFLNRAIAGIYSPGSAYKMLTGIAGLEEGVIEPYEKILDSGYFNYGGQQYECWTIWRGIGPHGLVDVSDALKHSCNVFFYEVAKRLGIEKLSQWTKKLGLGVKSGIDLPGEQSGIVAGPEYREKIGSVWYPGDTISAAIGQSDNAFTPIQLANYVATIANGGIRYRPHVVKKVVDVSGATVFENTPQILEDIELEPITRQRIIEGMKRVVGDPDGTGAVCFQGFPIPVAGKSGTAETFFGDIEKKTSPHATFVAFAPADNPEIAVAVVLEHGVRGTAAGEVVRDIMEAYFKVNEEKEVFNTSIRPSEPKLVP